MTFTASLFKLIAQADETYVAGYCIDEYRMSDDDTIQYVACDDVIEFGFLDQEVVVDNTGETGYVTPVSIVSDDIGLFEHLEPIRFRFRMKRPIHWEDLT